MKKAIIAMSGGVDSSVAALLTKESGDECIGATMKLYNNEASVSTGKEPAGPWNYAEDARSVAYQMDMPYYVFNFTADFHTEVMEFCGGLRKRLHTQSMYRLQSLSEI